MDIEIFTLCDAATDYSGRLNILGAFDTIYANSFPATHPQCSVALRIRFSKIEEGPHKVKVNFVDEDGRAIIPPFNLDIDVGFGENRQSVTRNMILCLHGIVFKNPGIYAVDLAIDGRQERSLPLTVEKISKEAPRHSSQTPLH